MLTKRAAIVALFSGAMTKMAHADDPMSKHGSVLIPPHPDTMLHTMEIVDWNQPMTWTINLDQMKSLDVTLNGKTVSVPPAEIFAALSDLETRNTAGTKETR